MPWKPTICMVLGCHLLVGALAAASQPGTDVLPLPTATGQTSQALIISTLIALHRGDATLLGALPVAAFTNPPALHEEAQEVQRRWTSALPGLLTHLDATARHAAEQALDGLYHQALPFNAQSALRARLAVDFFPAPDAVAELMHQADLAFDSGRFLDFLGIELVLEGPQNDHGKRSERERVALLLSGHGDQVDPALMIAPPGPPIEALLQLDEEPAHRAVHWHTQRGWLLACDPWDQVLWQVKTDPLAHVTPGDGVALVQDSLGLRAITDDGVITTLNDLPAQARVLSVAGGSAWFAFGTQGWRLRLADDTAQRLDFGAHPPLAPPLVRGETSLWLTSEEVLLFLGNRVQARVRHGLPVTDTWRLACERSSGRCAILAPDGRTWRLESLDEQVANALGPVEKAQLYVQATRYQDAIDILAAQPTLSDAACNLLIQAHLSLGDAHVLFVQTVLLSLARTPAMHIRVLQACVQGAKHSGSTLAADAVLRAYNLQIREMASRYPDLLFSPCSLRNGPASDFSQEPSNWPYVLSGAGYQRASLPEEPVIPANVPLTHLVDDQPQDIAAQALDDTQDHRLGDGSTRYLGRVIRLDAQIDRKQLTCLDQHGAMLWKRSWAGLPILSAPGCQVLGRDHAVIVIEGQRRLQAFALHSGELLIALDLSNEEDAHSDLAMLADHHLAMLGPPGVNTRLTLFAPARAGIDLEHAARWMMPLRDHIAVCFQDGSIRLYPGAEKLALPSAVMESRVAPIPTQTGLIVGTRRYPWHRL